MNPQPRQWRLSSPLRVEYNIGPRPVLVFATYVGRTGVFLRSASDLVVGQEQALLLHMGLPEAVPVQARTVSLGGGGAQVEFLPEQATLMHAIDRLLDEGLIPA